MPKTFYTERDIEDLYRQGVQSLEVNDDVVLTELAYEKAQRLGIKLGVDHDNPPAAPVRPYISQPVQNPVHVDASPAKKGDDLKKRVRDAVIARLGSQVDPVLLDAIIQRVLDNTQGK
ncbi:MAG: hypothetical protein P4L50_13615 [Anaerolineaceae bacterium]|nr:hypothetical protein [Anaerolineaceae bacterium]